MSYPLVQITDSTSYIASGTVNYLSAFCSDDNYTVTPNTTWHASSRGICLVTGVSAIVQTPTGNIVATPYSSSGTAYAQFVIVQTGPNSFAVTRLVMALEDQKPANHVEPAENQK